MPHWSLLYWAQDSSWQVAHQSPPVDGETGLRHHSHPHAGSLGTTRSCDLREKICGPTAEHKWMVRWGPGIGSHTGRRVREGHLKGSGPIGLKNKWHLTELNWESVRLRSNWKSWHPVYKFHVLSVTRKNPAFYCKCHEWSQIQMWLVQTCFCFCFDW